MPKSIPDLLSQINAELKSAKCGIVVCLRGDRLSLRGTFPPKPNSTKTKPHQQYLALGIYANPAGFKRAKSEALRVGGLIACKEFDWSEWLEPEPLSPSDSKKIADFLQEFESDYFSRKARTAKTETTFKDYLKSWEEFSDRQKPLSTETILEAVRSTPPDSHKRKRTCMAMKSLAKFARIQIDLKPYQGKYSPYTAIQERDLPSDEFIEEWRELIPNPAWKWAYGIIATYGIRSHELFYLDTSLLHEPPGILIVLPGAKNDNRHKVWPCLPEWWEKWKLWETDLPNCSGPDNSALGHRVSRAFNRYNVPFPPYNLRHAWAVRTAVAGLDPAIAARMMDHSLDVHTKLYHRWIGDKHFQQAWENMRFSKER
ncbi:site-specific integrase [Laspinema sp. D1]|uniref:Site-specific integrase n=1 Tax=Laspinema palackyanum D2a TaxID=2953684 RepID=A0ABT2MK82_9CYAN|nr:site-specific integrase [Laspinema sp. D2a]